MKLVYNDTSHSYWLDGKRVKSASKVAQIAADSFTVEQWQKRQVAIGMTLDRTLIERVAVDLDNREAIQQVCEDATNTAKANARAQRGTQRHRVFELGLLGRQDQFITDQQIADWKVLERTLDAYGLEPISDRVEQFVAWPAHGVVGRYDAYLKHNDRPVLVDLKGGLNAVKYPHSTAVQMWLYRNAPLTSATVHRDGDKSEVTDWTTMPVDADPDIGYVLYCDDHHDIGELWSIDLRAAQPGGELALGIVDWRKAHNYGKDLAAPILLEDEEAQYERDQSDDTWINDEAISQITDDALRTAASNARRLALLGRYQAMSEPEQLAYCDLHVDPTDLDAVEAGLNQVDQFNVVVPPAAVTRLEPVNPPAPPDEGGTVSDADVKALHRRFDRLDLDAQLWLGKIVAEGKQAYDFRIKDRPTRRRYEIYRGLLTLAEHGSDWGNDDTLNDLLDGIAPRQTNTAGTTLSHLDCDEAAEFARRVDFYTVPQTTA